MHIHPRAAAAFLLVSSACAAHVPFLEEHDYSAEAPLLIENVTNSKGLNARIDPAGDVDYYSITLTAPTRIVIGSDIPFCPQYREFAVTFALIGPGLPKPAVKLPVPLPEGDGAIVVREDITDPDKRKVYFERISGRLSWPGPGFRRDNVPPGKYLVIFWNEQGRTGDYIGVIGDTDIFGPVDREQMKKIGPRLEHGANLMVPCDPTAPDADERRKQGKTASSP